MKELTTHAIQARKADCLAALERSEPVDFKTHEIVDMCDAILDARAELATLRARVKELEEAPLNLSALADIKAERGKYKQALKDILSPNARGWATAVDIAREALRGGK